jgi:tripartite-type tricarboxylate transporter receptor subunit TctC
MSDRTTYAILAATCVGLAAPALAQSFPVKPIRMVVSFPPGGATDIFARTLAAEMTRTLRQQVVVDNRPGAATTIAAELVAKAPADGHTLLFTDLQTHTITSSIYSKLSYHPLRDFAPVAPVNLSPLLLVVHPSVGAKNVRELIAIAKKHPGTTLGNSGIGTVTHMTAERFRLRAGIEVTAVSYKGGSTPIVALLSGEVAMVMATIPASIHYVRQGKLVGVGLAAAKRSRYLPDMPTIGESLAGVEGAVYSGVLAPAGTPANVVQLLNSELTKAGESPKAKEVFATNVAETVVLSPAELSQALERDAKSWAEIVKATGVKIQ